MPRGWKLIKSHTMENPTDRRVYARSALRLLVAFGLTSAALFEIGGKDYPGLPTILDTGMCLLSGVLT